MAATEKRDVIPANEVHIEKKILRWVGRNGLLVGKGFLLSKEIYIHIRRRCGRPSG